MATILYHLATGELEANKIVNKEIESARGEGLVTLAIPAELFGLLQQLQSTTASVDGKRALLERRVLEGMSRLFSKTQEDVPVAQRIQSLLLADFCRTPTFHELCHIMGMTENAIQKVFRKAFGSTIFEYVHVMKMTRAKQELANGRTVKEVGYMLGYQNASHFSRAYKRYWGVSPAKSHRTDPISA
ncbi:AraC family transcriptional regulator [Pedobacter sp. MC2016-14]|uniref:helix-turn-helix transcriptional regulator n=1 Tax=Pedobacter sp. MC2016-14 TaxID=2897327 RepID=UPI001E4461D2|nr:AraC family transcriptional regulator [Pedobacter sp. MC2016-14]MCD0488308.1 AraC family transcriptional regulator [Pedobacter sp. MC2016-14]